MISDYGCGHQPVVAAQDFPGLQLGIWLLNDVTTAKVSGMTPDRGLGQLLARRAVASWLFLSPSSLVREPACWRWLAGWLAPTGWWVRLVNDEWRAPFVDRKQIPAIDWDRASTA